MKGDEFDYESIVKEYIKKDLLTAESEDNIHICDYKYWEAIKHFLELKIKEKELKTSIRTTVAKAVNKVTFVNNVESKRNSQDKKLSKLEQNIEELSEKCIRQMVLFTGNMEDLSKKFYDLDPRFDGASLKTEIESLNQKENLIIASTESVKKEIEETKRIIESCQIDTMPAVTKMEKILQNESLRLFGDSFQNQRRLAEIVKHTEFLKKKIADLK